MYIHIYYCYSTLGQAPEIFIGFLNINYLRVLGFGFLRRSTDYIHVIVCASVFSQLLKSKMDFKTPQALEPHLEGLDGVTYDLIIYKGGQEEKYSLWVSAPRGWGSFVDAANALLSAARLNIRVEIILDE